MHSWWKTQDFGQIESGPNYTTAAHAFVKARLRLGLRAPFVASPAITVESEFFETQREIKLVQKMGYFEKSGVIRVSDGRDGNGCWFELSEGSKNLIPL